jgi:hypothetical protein
LSLTISLGGLPERVNYANVTTRIYKNITALIYGKITSVMYGGTGQFLWKAIEVLDDARK